MEAQNAAWVTNAWVTKKSHFKIYRPASGRELIRR